MTLVKELDQSMLSRIMYINCGSILTDAIRIMNSIVEMVLGKLIRIEFMDILVDRMSKDYYNVSVFHWMMFVMGG